MLQTTTSIEIYNIINIIRELHEICKRIYNVIDTIIVNKCQINRLWKRLNLFLIEFEEVHTNSNNNSAALANQYYNDVKNLFLQIASHIESYVVYGPFKKLTSNHELEVIFDKFNSKLVLYSIRLGLESLSFLNKSVREMEDREDREEDNEYFNNILDSAMKSNALLLSFLGRVAEPEMIIEAISTLEDIINEDNIDQEEYPIVLEKDIGNRKLVYSQNHSQEIISAIRNVKKPLMDRRGYVNIDNIIFVCEHLKKRAQGLTVELKNWQIACWDIEIWDILSVGPFSKIYKAFWLGLDVAIKEMSYKINRVPVRKEFYKDVNMWYRIDHPNVLSLYGAYQLGDYPFVVIPLMKNGNLINYIEDKEKFPLIDLIDILIGISSGMEYLHSINVIHGDLMARNILLDDKLKPHICDFGFIKCRTVVNHHSKLKRLDSLRWTANEIHKTQTFNYTKKSDVYSFAMLCYELFTWGRVPFENLSERLLSEAVIEGKRPDYPEGCPKTIWKLMEKMWHENPDARPKFSSITKYLRNYRAKLSQKENESELPDNDNDPIFSAYMEENSESPHDSGNDNGNNSNVDTSFKNYGTSAAVSPHVISPLAYQRSPGRSPRHFANVDDVSFSGSGTGSIDLNPSLSPIAAHASHHPEKVSNAVASTKSNAYYHGKKVQGRKVSYNSDQGQGSRSHAQSNYTHSPTSGNNPIQLTTEMLPERFSSKINYNNSIKKPINVVQSGYRQRNSTVTASSSVSPNHLTNGNKHGNDHRATNNVKRHVVPNQNHSLQLEEENETNIPFNTSKTSYPPPSGYELVYKDVEEDNEYQEILNELSITDEEEVSENLINGYMNEEYGENAVSRSNFNEMENNYNYRYQKMFEEEFELSSLYEDDENYPYMYQVEESAHKKAYDSYPNEENLTYSSNYQKRTSTQNLTNVSIDNSRKSRSRSRSRTRNNTHSGHSNARSRSHSRSKSRNRSKRSAMEKESGEGTHTVLPGPRKHSLTSEATAAMNAASKYQTPPASRPHSPYNYDDNISKEEAEDEYYQSSQLIKSLKPDDEQQSSAVVTPTKSATTVPPISDRTEGVYKFDFKKDTTFSFMDDEDYTSFYPKDENCLSKLTFADIKPENVKDRTFTPIFAEQICIENPIVSTKKKDHIRDMLLKIYMREFKERFGEFKFDKIIKRNRIEFNTYGYSDWSYKRSAYKVLIDIIKFTHIKHLYIRNCHFGDPAIVALINALTQNNEFTVVDITFISKRSRPQQENNIMDIFNYDASNLEPSWVMNNNVTIKSGQLFANLMHQSPNLKAIHLRNAAFGNDCAQMMANALVNNSNIEVFELCNCMVTDVGATAFAEMLNHNKTLLRLILQQNNIGDKGANALSSALRSNNTLKYLLLQQCGITSKSISGFTPTLLNNTSLELIKFSSNNIGNDGARALAEGITVNSNIKQLWIDDCNISKKGIQAISKALDQNQVTEVHVGSVFKFWEKKAVFNSRIIIHRDLFS